MMKRFSHPGFFMNDVSPALPRTLGESITQEIRRMLVEGELVPGQRLSEAALAEHLDISRNTLREAFRVLTREGLLKHEPNRGVTVATPDMASIIDLYRVRRFIECKAIAQGYPQHPGTLHMHEAVELGARARAAKDWVAVGTANMMFHTSIVELADSPRLLVFYGQISAELRLAFGLLNDTSLPRGRPRRPGGPHAGCLSRAVGANGPGRLRTQHETLVAWLDPIPPHHRP
jgi:DNA-binding GntR family transcriptional regulator